jgi:NTE family protein
MNGVVVAEGLVEGGREKARRQLENFWRSVSLEALASPIQRSPFDVFMSRWSLDHNPTLAWFDAFTHSVSPYVFNPLNLNPLRDLLLQEVDFARVQACRRMQVFICATSVRTGLARVFTGRDVTVDAVMASACLPHLFQAVEIDGEPYWDGGFAGNPSLTPFIKSCASSDVVLVQINPVVRPSTPKTPREILDRMNEISFNTSLLKDLAQIEFINKALRDGHLTGRGYRPIHIHRIGGDGAFAMLSASSKLNAEWAFLSHLRDLGRDAAQVWLDRHFDDIGRASTLTPATSAGVRP